MAKVAFIGLGVMGYPMAGYLASRGGHDVTVYNRTSIKAEQWVDQNGGTLAATPSDAAKDAQMVFACVGNDEDLRQVTTGPDGAFQSMESGSIFIDHTTASAQVARELGAAAEAGGFGFLDAPVSGGQAGAENGALTVMVGGEQDVFDRARPAIDCFAKQVGLMGPVGAGQLTKMVNQICIAGLLQGLSEGIAFAKKGWPGCRGGDRGHFQGRGAKLADGESMEDHGCWCVRLRVRRRLDAQGPLHRARRSQQQWLAATCNRADRSVLC